MNKNLSIACLLSALLAGTLHAQDGSGFSLTVDPSLLVPLPGSRSAERYGLGLSTSLGADYILPALPFLGFGGAIDYALIPYGFDQSLSTIGGSAGTSLRWSPLPALSFGLSGRGGLSLGMLAEASALTPYASAQAGATLYLTPSFRLYLGGGYLHQFAASEALYQGMSIALSAGFNFSQMDRSAKTEIRDIIIVPVFPVFYKYYDDNSLGTLTLHNVEGGPIKNVRVSLFVKQYMDAPKECALIPIVERGESITMDLYALFTRQILGVLEPTKAQAEISVSYEYSGGLKKTNVSTSIEINHRNASLWDDDRKAASFVTMNDPAVMRLAKAAAGIARAAGYQSLDTSLRQAVGLLEQLRLYGVQYVPDPKVPYAKSSLNEDYIDYLQFPAQTLDYRAGDCDDMSILYAALLEAAGVESAFITVPGHIYAAFALGMSPAQARSFFTNFGDLIEQDGKIWLPVEVTIWNDGFMRAWQIGARQWRDAASKNQAALYPVRDAWKLYEPVAMIGSESSVELPKPDVLTARYKASMDALLAREITGPLATAKAFASQGAQDPLSTSKIGLVYARYGLLDKAEENFKASIRIRPTMQANANLGNVLYLKGDYKGALSAYTASLKLAPMNAISLAGLALCSSEMDDRDATARYLSQLASVDPAIAKRYSYLGDSAAGRAAQSSAPSLEWED